MTIYEALKTLGNYRYAEYFKWKHDIRFDQTLPKKSEEEFLESVDRKTMNGFLKWERSAQYKALLTLYFDTKITNDIEEIYKIVSDKAKQGDDKAVRLFLTLSKDIQSQRKNAEEVFKQVDDIEEDDGLELD
ncbi:MULTISPECIES: hypothetical protein [Bacillaceae]|uniref:Uncharacterized protein n=1 Tax=Evansella alkalicola TaxID=745819 RepID=A0ABS6JPQ3_9BACI|nr:MULTISPECIES: hypothetical protein [Bacillaceae]MBU9720546.1 hypothetical protein [Bacillus alkalicola]